MSVNPDFGIHFTGGDDTTAESAPGLSVVPTSSPSSPAPTGVATPAAGGQAGQVRHSPLGEFEKAPISRSEIKLSGAVAVNTNDETVISIDDRIRIVGEFRVTKVNFYVDKNGDVVRQQIITPIDDLQLTPWDPNDPTDDGIVRVRP